MSKMGFAGIFFKRANPGLFFYFRPFLITISIIQIEKCIDGVLEPGPAGYGSTDKTTELWQLKDIYIPLC